MKTLIQESAAEWIVLIRLLIAAGQSVRTMPPQAIAIVFVLGWLAGIVGSLAALLIVAALLCGLYVASVPSSPRVVERPALKIAEEPAPSAAHPLADTLAASGLVVREVKLAQPSAARAPKVKTA